MDSRAIGLAIVVLGLVLVLAGLAVAAGLFRWFGQLPGDIQISGRNVSVFFPIVSMLLISIVLTIVINIVLRLR